MGPIVRILVGESDYYDKIGQHHDVNIPREIESWNTDFEEGDPACIDCARGIGCEGECPVDVGVKTWKQGATI